MWNDSDEEFRASGWRRELGSDRNAKKKRKGSIKMSIKVQRKVQKGIKQQFGYYTTGWLKHLPIVIAFLVSGT